MRLAGRIPHLACLVATLAGVANGADGEDPAISEPAITAGDRDHWAFQLLARPAVPAVADQAWPKNAIDHFILARLEAENLAPAAAADRVTLLRRLSFDLTGLPPTLAQIDAFVNDSSADAYEKLVDRLLASPAYGERWAQHWLDLARFAETDGFEHDHIRPQAWRYRDWVIDSLNRDMPYDEFVRLQLAGDEIAPDDPESVVATGFLLCGPDMPDINSQAQRRHVFLNDMAANVGSVFLGLNVGCAQCHHHKFDPVSQHDFYRLRAFFDRLELFQDRPLLSPELQVKLAAFEQQQSTQIAGLKSRIADIRTQALQRIRVERKQPELKLKNKELDKTLNEPEAVELQSLQKQLRDAQRRRMPGLAYGRVAHESSRAAHDSYLYIRGDFRRPGPALSPQFLRVVATGHDLAPQQDRAPETESRRTALAEWLTRADHPLSTRVIVNRVWQHHFVHGLVRTPSDFGVMGDAPTHPELLDWLATELPRRQWSLKQLHRLIVTSATYRQTSRPAGNDRDAWQAKFDADPENLFLARMNRRRLEGEAIRDAMLAASDNLNRKTGGPGVRPPLPQELIATLLKNQWPVTPETDEHRRRSIYLFVRRNLRYPIFEVFDRPDTNLSCSQRDRSTIAPQALMLLNSQLSLRAAQALAGRILSESPADFTDQTVANQIANAYRRTLGRRPTDDETIRAMAFLRDDAEKLRQQSPTAENLAVPDGLAADRDRHHAAALTDFCLVLFNLNEFVYVD